MVNLALCISELLVVAPFLTREVLVDLHWAAPSSNFVLAAPKCLHEVASF